MRRLALIIVALLVVAAWPRSSTPRGLRVASKKFTESVILGEIVTQIVRAGGEAATHLAELGGTTLVYDALRRGEIDIYPEYTGTLREEIFAGRDASTFGQLQALLADQGIVMSRSLGFSNNYALAVRRYVAERLGLVTIADLSRHPELRLGWSNEFLDRADGWKNLRTHYGLPHEKVTGLDHDLAERWCDAWETEAALQGLERGSAFWDAGKAWIDSQCAARKRPLRRREQM